MSSSSTATALTGLSWLVASLSARQAELQAAIQAERARPVPDQALIRRMERETLLARDRIAAIQRNDLPPWASPPAGGGRGLG